MNTLTDVKVGDTVMVSLYGRRALPAVVEKVGRKYLTVSQSRFEIQTGRLASGYTGYAQTLAAYEEAAERTELVKTLRDNGIELRHGANHLSVAVLRRILVALDGEEQ